jgi:hypothetical protein
MRWADANHNLRRQRAEGQRARKEQSDQSLQKHNAFSFFSITRPRTNPGGRDNPTPLRLTEGIMEKRRTMASPLVRLH